MTPEERDVKTIKTLLARLHTRRLKNGADAETTKADLKRLISECIDAGFAPGDAGIDVDEFIRQMNSERNAGTNPLAPAKGGAR